MCIGFARVTKPIFQSGGGRRAAEPHLRKYEVSREHHALVETTTGQDKQNNKYNVLTWIACSVCSAASPSRSEESPARWLTLAANFERRLGQRQGARP